MSNEYLGELYVQTNRLDKAKERLRILENCNCEEYNELKEINKTIIDIINEDYLNKK